MTIGYKTIEVNSGATAYVSGDSGTGTGGSNTFTISPAKWKVGLWAGNFKLIDSAGTSFTIASNTTSVLTVTGTPATGAYTILPLVTGFIGGTTVIVDADKIDIDWSNSILSIQKPVSKTTQSTTLNNGNAYTYDSKTYNKIVNTTTNFDASLKQGDKIVLNGTTEYTLMFAPSGATATIVPMPEPPATGTLTCYRTQKDYGVNLKRIAHVISVDGWITNDNVHHTDYTTKKYVEEKAEDLYIVTGANAGNPNFANLAIRENSFLVGKFMRFANSDSGTGTGSASTMTDTKKAWTTNEWAGYVLTDSKKIVFDITSNTNTALTVTLNGGVGTPTTGAYAITLAVLGCLACTKLKLTDSAKESAPLRGGGSAVQRMDKMRVTLTFKYQDPK